MKNIIQFAAIIFFAFIQMSCEAEAEKCEQPQVCTDIFVTISLEIKNEANRSVALDDAYTFIDSRTKIEFELTEENKISGIYTVANDNHMDAFDYDGTTVIFVGEKDGANIIEHQMIIGKDCCHIQLITGETEIIIKD